MQSFKYTAVNHIGRTIRGVVSAENELDLEVRLKQAGLDMVAARAIKDRRPGFFSKIRIRDIILLCLHLEQLDRAGVPLHESLADIRDTTDSTRLRDVLTSIYESLKGGKMLSAALGEHPRVFNNVFVGLVAAGEKTGKLSDSFHHLGEHLKWISEIRRKIKKAIIYPIVLLFVITGVVSILMIFVVPKLISFIMYQGFTLPWHTRALIATSYAFEHFWFIIFGVPIAIFTAAAIAYRKSYNFAYRVDSIMLKMPFFGSVIRKIDMARFSRFFSVMFNSGIDVLEALNTARDVVHNRVLKESVEFVRSSVTEGNSLTMSLKISAQFPSLVIRMFKVGEDSGNMREALDNVNFFYDREVDDAVEGMVGLIQPMLTIVMGVIIFWVIAAVFGPLYESLGKMKF